MEQKKHSVLSDLLTDTNIFFLQQGASCYVVLAISSPPTHFSSVRKSFHLVLWKPFSFFFSFFLSFCFFLLLSSHLFSNEVKESHLIMTCRVFGFIWGHEIQTSRNLRLFFFFFFAGNKYWTSCSKEMEEETIFIECWLCTSHNAGSFHIPCFTYAPQQICRAGRAVLWSHFTEGETGLERSQPELTHLDRKKARIQTQEF